MVYYCFYIPVCISVSHYVHKGWLMTLAPSLNCSLDDGLKTVGLAVLPFVHTMRNEYIQYSQKVRDIWLLGEIYGKFKKFTLQ